MQTAFVMGLALVFGPERVAAEETDWWAIQQEVTSVLIKPDASLASLVRDVCKTPPADTQVALRKLAVVTRAGMTAESIETLRQLKPLSPQLRNHLVSVIYYDACDHHLDWELAEAVVTIFAENVSEMDVENRLLRHFSDAGWTPERVDQWLAEKPAGKDGFWAKTRLHFNVSKGRADAYLKDLEQTARSRPQDVAGVIRYLETILLAGLASDRMPDLKWIAESVKPALSSEAHEIASLLVRAGALESALPFFHKAIDTPLNGEELEKKSSMMQAVMMPDAYRKVFAAGVREELAQCLMDLKRADEAQKWMVEAETLRGENHLGSNPQFAGQVQAASGGREIESRIIAKEEVSKTDPKYWLERANYYQGRSEAALEEEALLKALSLTTSKEPELSGKGYFDPRSQMLLNYARFLIRQKRENDAVELLRKELSDAPATAQSPEQAARILAYDLDAFIKVDDPVLWAWLEKRPSWSGTEERLLWRMLQQSPKETLNREFTRAEKLTAGRDASRAAILGWIENRMGEAKRSIPLLEEAVNRTKDYELRKHAGFTLLESYLDIRDWKKAETIFPSARELLTYHEIPEWYGKIAVAAARTGANDDAMRIWKRAANFDLTCLNDLDDLAKAGLGARLIEFYKAFGKEIPGSQNCSACLLLPVRKSECDEIVTCTVRSFLVFYRCGPRQGKDRREEAPERETAG